jgi:hypothetical protein
MRWYLNHPIKIGQPKIYGLHDYTVSRMHIINVLVNDILIIITYVKLGNLYK